MTETFIVAGSPRTGTSLIAGTLHILGIPMGESWVKEGTYEDIDFAKSEKFTNEICDTIWKRNQSSEKWGFKWPLAWKYMWIIASQLKQPKVIYTYRNIVSLQNKRPDISIFRHMKTLGFWGSFLEIHRYPVIFIDYDEAISNDPSVLVDKLCEFCELKPTKSVRKKAIDFNTKGKEYNTKIKSH